MNISLSRTIFKTVLKNKDKLVKWICRNLYTKIHYEVKEASEGSSVIGWSQKILMKQLIWIMSYEEELYENVWRFNF